MSKIAKTHAKNANMPYYLRFFDIKICLKKYNF